MDEIKNKVLTAPEIDNYRYCLNHSNKRFTVESLELLPTLFAELKKIAPCNENGLRVLYCEAERGSIEDYGDFDEKLANGDVKNREEFEGLWCEEYPSETKWFEFRAHEENGYMAIWLDHQLIVDVCPENEAEKWGMDIVLLLHWLTDSVKTCITEIRNGTYNEKIRKELPVEQRTGTLSRKALWKVCPQEKEEYFANLSDVDVREFLDLMTDVDESRQPLPKTFLKTMTSRLFFRACALGYEANNYEGCGTFTPKELYLKHADGRDEGLRNVRENSPDAFAKWYEHDRYGGGHPWEVCRGGNSTHVSLFVNHQEQGYFFSVAGKSWSRSVEAIKFFLALHRSGLPVVIFDGKELAARVAGVDKIGIVPQGVLPRYCESLFPNEKILDFMNLPYDNREKFASYVVWQDVPEVRLL